MTGIFGWSDCARWSLSNHRIVKFNRMAGRIDEPRRYLAACFAVSPTALGAAFRIWDVQKAALAAREARKGGDKPHRIKSSQDNHALPCTCRFVGDGPRIFHSNRAQSGAVKAKRGTNACLPSAVNLLKVCIEPLSE